MLSHTTSLGLSTLALLSIASASDPRLLARQDASPCFNPESRARDQSYYVCPHKTTLNSDQTCPGIDFRDTQRWFYGKEIPFPNTNCEASDATCSIQSSLSTTYTNEFSFNVGFTLGKRDGNSVEETHLLQDRDDPAGVALDGLKASFNAGASWSFSTSQSSGTANTNTKPTSAKNQCGYWTFVPYYIESCGTMSYQQQASQPNPNVLPTYQPPIVTCTGNVQNQANFCQSTPYLDSSNNGVGETIFVATDCTSNKPLPFCYQRKTYLQEGVSSSPDPFIEYLYAHTPDQINNRDASGPAQSSAVHACFDNKWNGNFDTDPSWQADGIGSPAAAATDATNPNIKR